MGTKPLANLTPQSGFVTRVVAEAHGVQVAGVQVCATLLAVRWHSEWPTAPGRRGVRVKPMNLSMCVFF